MQARAQARLKAEMDTRAKSPRDWLRLGPGREQPGRPGWTNPAKAGTAHPDGGGEGMDMTLLLDVLESHPQARLAAAEVVEGKKAKRRADIDDV
jgi:hypothetical protein